MMGVGVVDLVQMSIEDRKRLISVRERKSSVDKSRSMNLRRVRQMEGQLEVCQNIIIYV